MTDNNTQPGTVGSIPKIFGDRNITVMIDNKTYSIDDSHLNFDEITELLKNPNTLISDLLPLFDIPKAVEMYSSGNITIDSESNVLYQGKAMHNALTRRMIEMLNGKYDISSLVAFMDNLMLNPSRRAVEELYEFLESNDLPITPDGHFLAYKRVRDDYRDFHTGTFDNSIGKVVSVGRNEVDDDRSRDCSNGLHFCSLKYLGHFHGGSGRVLIVKVNPKDVVAFPVDYQMTKGRTCAYEVVGEHAGGEKTEAFSRPVHDEFNDSDDNDDNFCPMCGIHND